MVKPTTKSTPGSTTANTTTEFSSPLRELSFLIDRVEQRIREARIAYWVEWRRQIELLQSGGKRPSLAGRLFGRRSTTDTSNAPAVAAAVAAAVTTTATPVDNRGATTTTTTTTTSSSSRSSSRISATLGTTPSTPLRNITTTTEMEGARGGAVAAAATVDAVICVMPEHGMVEDLRRIAELVIIGENAMLRQERKQKRILQRDREQWNNIRDRVGDTPPAGDEPTEGDEDETIDVEMHLQMFDLFFERNTLETIISMLLGTSLDLATHRMQDATEDAGETLPSYENSTTVLPPLSVATQAIQSISIMIQNVSRVTSLYVILSSNRINSLIGLPLHLYETAEYHRLSTQPGSSSTTTTMTPPRNVTNPVITELTTHFVTFLKSLALRMTAETLQFFLTYPPSMDGEDGNKATADVSPTEYKESQRQWLKQLRSVPVEFPLYERALDFCGAHHDSFIRVTAMNICLNTLRLTTTVSDESDDEKQTYATTVPDGNLHNSNPLPFRERFAMAHFACIPLRVERLIAPIFTKLAERWNAIEEVIREMDSHKRLMAGKFEARSEKVAKIKEEVRRERLLRTFKDKAADLQDELLLLDDVFQVGLTVLNEQTIEMLFATFVYPLLLQPLLVYYKRLEPAMDQTRSRLSDHPFNGYCGDVRNLEEAVAPAAGPAKAALFTLASAFQLLTNRPLRRLLFTALFHPLSPDSTSVPSVRIAIEVAALDNLGHPYIRRDESYIHSDLVPDGRATYAFGTNQQTVKMNRTSNLLELQGDNPEACVFVLAPALAEMVDFRGEDLSLLARAKVNPYRHALLHCLRVPDEFSDVRKLSVCLFDSAVSIFDGPFAGNMLFGIGLRKFDDNVPADERTLDSVYAHTESERGLGGRVAYESRHSVNRQQGAVVGADHVADVVNALCSCIVFAKAISEDIEEWEIGYDEIAVHALFNCIRFHPRAILLASKIIEQRWKQASSLVTARASSILSPMGGSSFHIRGTPSINDPRYDEKLFNAILDILLYGSHEHPELSPAIEDIMVYGTIGSGVPDSLLTSISCDSSFHDLCNQVGAFLQAQKVAAGELDVLQSKRDGFCCLFKIDALLSLLRDLAATGGLALLNKKLESLLVSRDGACENKDMLSIDMSRRLYSMLSLAAVKSFLSTPELDKISGVGSVISLADSDPIPCVCEVLADTGGLTWQSFYIIVRDSILCFVRPLAVDEGQVASVCPLERIWVERDSQIPASDVSRARKLVFTYSWYDLSTPPLFMFDSVPQHEAYGPFHKLKALISRVDVWFEDDFVASQALSYLSGEIFTARATRGQRLQEFLSS